MEKSKNLQEMSIDEIEKLHISDVSGRYSLEEAKKFAMEKFNAEELKSNYPNGGRLSIDEILFVLEAGVECGYKFGQKSNDH